jgi:ABC-2 type transport system ATP-binding protein
VLIDLSVLTVDSETKRQAAPVTIEVRDLSKTFRIPKHRITSFKERAVRPFAQPEYRELRALDRVSFDVRRGEFFGVVGRNGSGKSTLLKVLASIYKADGGRVRMAGRLAPFIELGVGFNPDLTARENVVLNGVMMGLSRQEARRRLGAVLEFAELEEFVELPLKNYSSGMMVRLAFAVMIQADTDILLIDEVLAVGDAAFAKKCADTFHQMRDAGKTIVFVTHDMLAVEEYCHRAMLINDGEITFAGEPKEVARRYLKLNFERTEGPDTRFEQTPADQDARIVRAWLENSAGEPVGNLEEREPIRLRMEIEAVREIKEPSFGFNIANFDDVQISAFGTHLEAGDGSAERLAPGERVRLSADIENPLTSGHYAIGFWVCEERNVNSLVARFPRVLEFAVYGSAWTTGIVSLGAEIEAVRETKS